VATDPQLGYGRDTVNGCVRYIEERDRRIDPVLLCKGLEDPDRLTRQFDAFLLSGRSPWILPYISDQPVVHLDLSEPRSDEICISTDTESIGRLAAELLWNRGMACFGYCDYPAEPQSDSGRRSKARLRGFIQGLEERGIQDAGTSVQCHTLGTAKDILSWMEHLSRPAGIFTFNDSAALEVLQACSLLRLQVPHEIAIVGVDNDQLVCNLSHPSISTVDIDLPGLAYQGLSMLEQMLEGTMPNKPHTIVPVFKTIQRESTGHFSTTVDERLVRAVRYINDHAHLGASVADVVRASRLGQRHLEILFRKHRGRTPQEELIAVRHEHCLKELRVRRAPIEDICSTLGMSHHSVYRNFRRFEGCTPAEYRNYFMGGAAPVRNPGTNKTDIIQIGMLSSFQWQASRDFMEGATAYAQTDPSINLILHDRARFASWTQLYWYDGAIVVSGDEIPDNANPQTPVLYHAYEQNLPGAISMQVDEIDVGLLAGRHFLRKGHRNFAYCAYFDIKPVTPRERKLGLSDRRSRDRQAGFRAAIHHAGLHGTCIHTYFMDTDSRPMIDWLKELPKPIALFCFNDQMATQILLMCQNHGIKVPREIAILGVDNSPGYCRLARPALSSIDIGFPRIGAHTLKNFIAYIRKERPVAERIFPAQMVRERGSTAGIASDDPELGRAVEFIETHFQDAITVDDLAEVAGIGRRLLEMRFKRHLRTTPRRYLLETRLLHAEELLIYSSMRINEIAEQCGFRQTNHFCRAFREHCKATPRVFRNQRGALEHNPITCLG